MTRISLIFIITLLISCTSSQEEILYSNYEKAFENESTFQNFLVIHVTDLNTGQTRDICTQGNFLRGAIHTEYKLGYDDYSIKRVEKIALSNRTRTFQFKNVKAMENLGWDRYSMDDLKKFEEKNDINKLSKQINEGWKKWLANKEMLLYAHALFNRGILTGESSCFGGALEVR